MPALVAGIHVFLECSKQDVDGRHKAGHDTVLYFFPGLSRWSVSMVPSLNGSNVGL